MRIPGVKTAKFFTRWVQARIFGGALILGYHRVASVEHDRYEVCVKPGHFTDHMDVLRKYAYPISLPELVQCLKEGFVPPRSVAVTFDDGYIDNLTEGKPVLEKYEIPATVFVCTGYPGREFWWDELDRLIMTSTSDLSDLNLKVGKSEFVWDQPDVNPEAGSPGNVSFRRKIRHALYHFMLALDVKRQNQAMDIIRSWAGGVSSDKASSARSMSHAELLQLVDGGLIEIGAHTRSHPMLPRLDGEQQREEIFSSKQDLEELLGKRVDGFAYPNGRATIDAKKIVSDAGFTFACTSLHDVVRPASDLHELTRIWQKDVDGDFFLQGLHLWMKGS